MNSIWMKLALLLSHTVASSQGLAMLSPRGRRWSYAEMRELLENGARGQDTDETIRVLELAWRRPNSVLKKRWWKHLIPLRLLGSNQHMSRAFLARQIVRFHLQVGSSLVDQTDYPYKTYVEQDVDFPNGSVTVDHTLSGDLLMARREYEAAIDAYSKAVRLGMDSSGRSSIHFGPVNGIDDVLFTKIGFAYEKLNRDADANRNWEYAGELQESQGLWLEAVVSKMRQDRTQAIVPEALLGKYYPTILRALKSGVTKDTPTSTNDVGKQVEDSLLDAAFAKLVQGDYPASHRYFAKLPDTNMEKWGLFSVLLRERQMDDLSNCYAKLAEEVHNPFSLLKRGVLNRAVHESESWGQRVTQDSKNNWIRETSRGNVRLDAFDAIMYGNSQAFKTKAYDDSADALILRACEKLASSSLRATAYFQIAVSLRPSSFTAQSVEDEQRQDACLSKQLSYLKKALDEPGITSSVRILAAVAQANAKLSLAEHKVHNGYNGENLESKKALRSEGRSKLVFHVLVESNSERGTQLVARVPREDEALREKREATLSKCFDQLQQAGLENSLTALELSRQMRAGPTERLLLTTIFGKASAPVLNTRKSEYYEDIRSGNGERAEAIAKELLAEETEEGARSFHLCDLASALEKQEKYLEAVAVYQQLLDTDKEYQRSIRFDKGIHEWQVAQLYLKNGDLDMASTMFHELASMELLRWQIYGFLGLGQIALQQQQQQQQQPHGDLKDALHYFRNGVAKAEAKMKSVFEKSSSRTRHRDKSTERSNAIATVSRAWSNAGDSLMEHHFYEEALEFYQGCYAASDNEWFSFRENTKKRLVSKIAKVEQKLASTDHPQGSAKRGSI